MTIPESPINAVLNLYKRKSETPLATIEHYVRMHPEYNKTKMTYAGRLDPMAEGVLVVLAGEKNKERDVYTGLDKDYVFEFILGVETDTFDVLGKIVAHKEKVIVSQESIKETLEKYKGKINQTYPSFSSKVVDGKHLFEHARGGTLGSVTLPSHEVTVSSIELVGSREISKEDLNKQINTDISRMKGDFRQVEILAGWDSYFKGSAPESFTVFKVNISCGSGFYVRQLVSDMGKDLGAGAVTISIVRTRVGKYEIADSVR